ncbi:Clavaminate synthase-like protein [Didymella exigua CBS 183.55]|uniref:Clavaminate synthase-like protein n=1 Tax=Didymella exigua CBS 183.55 TaxID=1150837 RepID=A0A6A5RIN8_9PLEO|nr:Clavaminate synthase-like protein [Didymella exigua CBS 183.55]KAF1927692.1 Clavaminate synthase-like protein [Didymella exigua CBS 183.55]
MLVQDEVMGLRDPEQASTRTAPTGLEAGATLNDAVRDLITTYHDLNTTKPDILREEPSPLEFMRYVARNRPFVIKNGATGWKARQKWNASYLKEVMQGQTVNVSLTPHGNADSVISLPSSGSIFVKPYERSEDFSSVLDAIVAQTHSPSPSPKEGPRQPIRYAQTQNDNLRDEYTSLFADVPASIPFARVALGQGPDAVNFWLGSAASVTALHKDNYENIYVQILGRKHFVLLPPVDAPCVNERSVLAGTYAPRRRDHAAEGAEDAETEKLVIQIDEPATYVPFATWDPDVPSVNATPYSKYAQPMRVALDEGDMLYLPALWYHKVSQSCNDEGLCCAVNYWYDLDFGGGFWSTAGFVRTVGLLSAQDGEH